MSDKFDNIASELLFRTSRSGGKGGQNVNKVETKVELIFNVKDSKFLTEEEKSRLGKKLKNRLDKNGIIKITSQTERSQYMNKLKSIKRFFELLEYGLKKEKKRIKTKPSAGAKESRIQNKKLISQKKSGRSKPTIED